MNEQRSLSRTKPSLRLRRCIVLLACAQTLWTHGACVAISQPMLAAPVPADLRVGAMANKTSFETQQPQTTADRTQAARTGVFATGVTLGALGLIGTIVTGAVGETTQRQLASGFEDGDLTRARATTLSDRGDLMNNLAITSAAVGLVGLVAAAVALGVDYTLCGRLTHRRKTCK